MSQCCRDLYIFFSLWTLHFFFSFSFFLISFHLQLKQTILHSLLKAHKLSSMPLWLHFFFFFKKGEKKKESLETCYIFAFLYHSSLQSPPKVTWRRTSRVSLTFDWYALMELKDPPCWGETQKGRKSKSCCIEPLN